MNYYHMSLEDINNRSFKHLMALYAQYPTRALENLGISADKKGEQAKKKAKGSKKTELIDSDYPRQLVNDKEKINEINNRMQKLQS